MKVPGANLHPDFAGIIGTLEACSSQTSSFTWTAYFAEVRNKIRKHLSPPCARLHPYDSDPDQPRECLSSNILLAAMDYLYFVQSLPEDRNMVLKSQEGMVPIIVWAHSVLGLTVPVCDPTDQSFQFGDG